MQKQEYFDKASTDELWCKSRNCSCFGSRLININKTSQSIKTEMNMLNEL